MKLFLYRVLFFLSLFSLPIALVAWSIAAHAWWLPFAIVLGLPLLIVYGVCMDALQAKAFPEKPQRVQKDEFLVQEIRDRTWLLADMFDNYIVQHGLGTHPKLKRRVKALSRSL
jgi:hypothetical protein